MFVFELNQSVQLNLSSEKGFVTGRAQYTNGDNDYRVRYLTADGRQDQEWFSEDAISPV